MILAAQTVAGRAAAGRQRSRFISMSDVRIVSRIGGPVRIGLANETPVFRFGRALPNGSRSRERMMLVSASVLLLAAGSPQMATDITPGSLATRPNIVNLGERVYDWNRQQSRGCRGRASPTARRTAAPAASRRSPAARTTRSRLRVRPDRKTVHAAFSDEQSRRQRGTSSSGCARNGHSPSFASTSISGLGTGSPGRMTGSRSTTRSATRWNRAT